MRRELIIRLLSTPAPVVSGDMATSALRASWVLREDNRFDHHVFQGELKDAADQATGARVTVLVPSDEVTLSQVAMPNLKSQKLAKAVPYALEDQLADDVEDLHVAVGQRDAEGRVANAVVAREVLDNWLVQLREAGLNPDLVSPELFGVTWTQESETPGWSLVLDGHHALLRTDSQMGLAFDMDNLLPVVRAALEGVSESMPARLTVTVCEDTAFEHTAQQHDLEELCQQQEVELIIQYTDSAGASLLAAGFDEHNAINLLQGEYSLKGQLEKVLRPWRAALVLLVAWLVLQAGLLGAEYFQLSREQAALNLEISQLFQQAFPDKRLVPGAEKELMERGLNELRSGGSGEDGFLDLVSRSGGVLQAESGIRLRSLRYKDNKLDMDLELPDLQVLDRLKQAFANTAGLGVDIVSASARDGKVESRLTLQSASDGSSGGSQ